MAQKIKRGGGSKKWRQNAHNKATGKYVRQRVRTERNKTKRKAKREGRADG